MGEELTGEGCGQGSAALLLFGASVLAGVLLTPVRGLTRTLVHAFHHPGCAH